jgi:hypothetical protein
MAFNADLNPKKTAMGLGELLKMEEALVKNKLYNDAAKAKSMKKTATPAADAILSSPNMLKSSADDLGTEFRFNSNQKD